MNRYLGSGLAAALAVAEIAKNKLARIAVREALLVEQVQSAAIDQLIAELLKASSMLVTAALTAAGYHCPTRTWRKRRAQQKAD